ncbi:MAG: LamG-like jellyroll fold domain-containing protein [Polaromonas sp.]|nr:LamG-like jellyroll fold domain-containing protein [Polaromonas sp.]MDP3752138.1 LamG-like jellyroll fold domain-containing protein [Polaromonas sp.]
MSGGGCACKKDFEQVPGQNICAKLELKDTTQEPRPQVCVGNPIYPLTGSKVEPVATGIEVGGVELRLTYDSVSKAPGSISSSNIHLPSFGALWFTNMHRRLSVAPTLKAAVLSRGGGRIVTLTGTGTGIFTASSNRNETLVSIPGGSYRFTDIANGIQELYNAGGQLFRITTTQGKVLNFIYASERLTSIRDNEGKVIRFAYASAGAGGQDLRISHITDTVGRTVTAGYDAAGNLVTLTWQDSKVRQFLYENTSFPWALTGVIDENNTRYATFGYDSAGRAISTEYAGGVGRYSVSYGQGPAISVVDNYDTATNVLSRNRSWVIPDSPVLTKPNGETATMGVQNQFGMPSLTTMSQPAGSGCAAATSALAYDTNGNIARKDDFTGMRSCYAYDSKNLAVTTVEGLANTVDCATVLPANSVLPPGSRKLSNQWHPDWSLTSKVAQPLSITNSVYNGQADPFNANVIASCAPSTAKTPDGKPIAVLCKQVVQATTDARGSLGLTAALDASVAQRVSRFTYDALGRLLTSTDPLNRLVTQTYYGDTVFTGNGQPAGPIDLAMDSVSLLLHGDGIDGAVSIADSSLAPKPVTVGGNAKISTTQSKFGGAALFFDGTQDYVSLPSDSSLYMGASDFTIEMWIYKLGNNSNQSRLWNPNGDSYADVYMGIDEQGRLVHYGSWSGNSWNAWSGASGTIPNNVWRHVALVRSGGTVTSYVDGVGTVMTSTLGFATLFDGNYAHVIGGQGVGADRAFNGYIDEVRVSKGVARYTANFIPPTQAFPNVGEVLDPTALGHRAGDLQSITNAAGHITQFNQYDQAGRVRQITDAKGVVTDTTYTPRGWVASTTVTPPGGVARTTTYTYDNVGQLTQAQMPDGSTLGYSYDAAHRLVGVTDAKGNSMTYTLDNMGNRVGEQVKDAQGNLQHSITRVYDALNRVQQVTGAAN